MKLNIKNRNQGFTIIEVLIVLAIAGLILLIVFLAVPALQRNNRNTQRRNDAARVLGAVSEFSTNNRGAVPASITNDASVVTLAAAAGANPMTTDVTLFGTVSRETAVPTPVDNDTLYIIFGARCDGNTVTLGQPTRSYVAYFNVETSGNPTPQCAQS